MCFDARRCIYFFLIVMWRHFDSWCFLIPHFKVPKDTLGICLWRWYDYTSCRAPPRKTQLICVVNSFSSSSTVHFVNWWRCQNNMPTSFSTTCGVGCNIHIREKAFTLNEFFGPIRLLLELDRTFGGNSLFFLWGLYRKQVFVFVNVA